MSKTPVTTLQEFMAKGAHGLPEYVIVAERNGTHLASFTYRVTCGNLSALGTASCKKEAKHNAAREMLKLLSHDNNTLQRTPMRTSLSPQKPTPVDSYYSPNTSGISDDKIFVNSVGKLNEHCTMHKFKPPKYTESDIRGPPHMRLFTITCSVGSLSASGTASTKKDAKHDAAQKMYQLLIKTTPPKTRSDFILSSELKNFDAENQMMNVKMLESKLPKLSMPPEKSSERAKKLFPMLRSRDSVNMVKNVDVKDYHVALKNSVSVGSRETAQQKLHIPTVSSKERILEGVLEILNLKLKCTTALTRFDECVVYCTVNSKPVISDMGFGKTFAEAREEAIENLLVSVNLLLT